MKIFNRITEKLEENLPFVVYRKPNKKEVLAFFQKDANLNETSTFSDEGFVFAPFDSNEKAVLIPKEKSEYFKEYLKEFSSLNSINDITDDLSSKENHINLITSGIKAIKSGAFKKVVLSRKEKVDVNDFDVLSSFKKLLIAYPNAFVYLWFHPKVGLWLGATPETLIKIKGDAFETMSLAGTQEFKGNVDVMWKPKELFEQQLVTDYVLDKLKPICNGVEADEVKTIKAGNLLHLKTQIKGVFSSKPVDLIKVLHPTPAVCGFPKDETKEFIINNENYNREYYTGFLGELNLPNSELFVNLRCFQVIDKRIFIYVGGGITKDSNPEKEWEETVAKTKTVKKVL